jgi:hypothetical protein
MRVALVVLVAVLAGSARADPADQPEVNPDEPALQLDPILRSEIEGFGARRSELSHPLYRLGPHARAQIQTSVWTNDRDVLARGWTVSARVSRELGWGITLTLDAGLYRMLGGIGREDGMYRTFGVALTRLFHWSHKRVAWISLSAEHDTWVGAGSSRIPTGTVGWLHAGTTF